MNDKKKLEALIKVVGTVLNENITVACVTCNQIFLNMKYKDYLPLLHGDLRTPTRWYNKVVLHFCQHPNHHIISNRSQTGINQAFDYSKDLTARLHVGHVPLSDLYKVAKEKETEAEFMPI